MEKLVLALTLLLAVSGFAQKSKLSLELSRRHDKSMTEVIIRYKGYAFGPASPADHLPKWDGPHGFVFHQVPACLAAGISS
jgi:hypothetical protein